MEKEERRIEQVATEKKDQRERDRGRWIRADRHGGRATKKEKEQEL